MNKIVGLIPAAGHATRIAPIPCSKEIYPIGFAYSHPDVLSHPRVVSSYLLESMQATGLQNVYMVIRKGKWDIPEYLLNSDDFDLNFAYLVTHETPGTSFSIDKAYPFIKDKNVIVGFPDIIFEPKDAFKLLLQKLGKTQADIVLGLFEADNPQKMDMVQMENDGNIKKIIIKPEQTELQFTWIVAAWTPAFTEYLHNYLANISANPKTIAYSDKLGNREIYIGDIMQEAINEGLTVQSVTIPNGFYIDIGTVDDLKKAVEAKLTDFKHK